MINNELLNDTWVGFLNAYVLANFYNENPKDADNAEKLLWILRRLHVHINEIQGCIEADGIQDE